MYIHYHKHTIRDLKQEKYKDKIASIIELILDEELS